MAERWWREVPEGIKMTDQRARDLLARRVEPANEAEEIFFDANASTMIPLETKQKKANVVPAQSGLGMQNKRQFNSEVKLPDWTDH